MKSYLDLLGQIYSRGHKKHPTRVESGETTNETIGLPHLRFDHDLRSGFPFITTRQMFWQGMVGELRSFIEGAENNEQFKANGCDFWTPWAMEGGNLGPIYGTQWNAHGQLDHVLNSLKAGGTDRRMVVTAWRPDEHDKMALPPCHVLWNVVVYNGAVHLHWHQRSCDFPVGVPTNIASYALLTHLLAEWSGLEVGGLSATFGDAHIYENQMEAVVIQLGRSPKALPLLEVGFEDREDFGSWKATLHNYQFHDAINFGDLEI